VGGYTLLTKIGEGGMGVVHLARRGDGPRVAL
jgi:serine/threonine protein kinase